MTRTLRAHRITVERHENNRRRRWQRRRQLRFEHHRAQRVGVAAHPDLPEDYAVGIFQALVSRVQLALNPFN